VLSVKSEKFFAPAIVLSVKRRANPAPTFALSSLLCLRPPFYIEKNDTFAAGNILLKFIAYGDGNGWI
jgi:hypothetical protein